MYYPSQIFNSLSEVRENHIAQLFCIPSPFFNFCHCMATVHVQIEADGETPPATWVTGHRQYPPLLWGLGCAVQEPGVTDGIRPYTSVVNLRVTGQYHSPGQSVQLPTDPAPRWNNGPELGLNQALFSVGLGRTKFPS
jgi:hypothetical protein